MQISFCDLKMSEESEKFYAYIIEVSGVQRITIPKNIVEGAGLKAGDKLKVIVVKIND